MLVVAVVVFATNYTRYQGNAIPDKETALAVGWALLEGRFGPDPEMNLNAIERNGRWRVYHVVDRGPWEVNGLSGQGVLGGELYVEFRKRDGRVLRFGID